MFGSLAWLGLLVLGVLQVLPLIRMSHASDATAPGAIEVGRHPQGQWQTLRVLTADEIRKLGSLKTLSEVWPGAIRKSVWQGALVSDVIQKALDSMTVEERAQVDLVVLQAGEGPQAQRALIPRALLKNFPFLLASMKDGKPSIEGWVSIPPQSSRSKLQAEGLPIESYFLQKVSKIELANSWDRFSSVILKRRTDPIAVRGERVFVSSCLACHESGRAPSLQGTAPVNSVSTVAARLSPTFGSVEFKPLHRTVHGAPTLSDRDWQSLRSYWEAVKAQPAGIEKPFEAERKDGEPKGAEASDQSGGSVQGVHPSA